MSRNFEIMKTDIKKLMTFTLIILFTLSNFSLHNTYGAEDAQFKLIRLKDGNCLFGFDLGSFDELTLTMWIQPNDYEEELVSILSTWGWERSGLHLLLEEGNRIAFCINSCQPEELISKNSCKSGKWTHLAVTYNRKNKNSALYLNGKLDSHMDYEEAVSVELQDFYIGAWNIDPRLFNGQVADVRIFSKALDAEDIQLISKHLDIKLKPDLWWKTVNNEHEIIDHSGNEHHGEFMEAEFGEFEEDDEDEGDHEEDYRDNPSDWRNAPVQFTPRFVSDLHKNPLIDFDKIVFIKRQTFHSSHFYTDFIDGCSRYGGNLCILDLKSGKVTDLIPEMKDGIFGRFNLHFSAKKIVFDWKKAPKEGFRIYEIDIDPVNAVKIGKPRQLTFPPADEADRIKKYDNSQNGGTARMYYHQTDDMHPCYLPDGGIAFTSTRCEYGTLCDAPDHLSTAVIHRLNNDGSIEQLTHSPVSEFSPSIMEDGRILYTRWEYVDKGQLGIKCLWAMYPDGSKTVEIYGNDIHLPPTFLHGRQIPDRPNQFVMLGTPHYPQSGIGTVIHVDTTKNIRTRDPMTYVTPYVDIRQEPGWNQYKHGKWSRHTNGPLYMDPYPLSKELYMVSFNPDKPWDDAAAYGLYFIDNSGRHQKIHDEPSTSCWQPTPLIRTKQPPILATSRIEKLAKEDLAICIVQDIYQGMEGIERGEVKYIRVMEQIPRPWDCRQFWEGTAHTSLISYNTALAAKAMHGVIPVYEDGSAHFYVPADRNIYFQALDENFMELQRERTYVNYRPGEVRSCVGCHEQPAELPTSKRITIAMKKAPVMPGPQPGDTTGQQVIHYPSYVQPVLDKYCIKCHSGDDPTGKLNLTGEMTESFCVSYENIMERGLIKTYAEFSDWDGSPYAPPKTIGSHTSKFIKEIRHGEQHAKLNLPIEDFAKLATWVDASGVYYGSYWGRRLLKYKDHPNFRPVPTFAEALSTTCTIPVEER